MDFFLFRRGEWANHDRSARVVLDEDYKRTFRLYLIGSDGRRNVVLNAAGNTKRFHSLKAAVNHHHRSTTNV